jgi:hypothetical protein
MALFLSCCAGIELLYYDTNMYINGIQHTTGDFMTFYYGKRRHKDGIHNPKLIIKCILI